MRVLPLTDWSCGFSSIERVVITTKLVQALCICFSWVVAISCVSMATTTHPFCFSLPELRFSAAAWTVLEGSPTASLNCCLWTLNDSPARRASTGLAKLGNRRSLVLESRWSITKLSGLSFHKDLQIHIIQPAGEFSLQSQFRWVRLQTTSCNIFHAMSALKCFYWGNGSTNITNSKEVKDLLLSFNALRLWVNHDGRTWVCTKQSNRLSRGSKVHLFHPSSRWYLSPYPAISPL